MTPSPITTADMLALLREEAEAERFCATNSNYTDERLRAQAARQAAIYEAILARLEQQEQRYIVQSIAPNGTPIVKRHPAGHFLLADPDIKPRVAMIVEPPSVVAPQPETPHGK